MRGQKDSCCRTLRAGEKHCACEIAEEPDCVTFTDGCRRRTTRVPSTSGGVCTTVQVTFGPVRAERPTLLALGSYPWRFTLGLVEAGLPLGNRPGEFLRRTGLGCRASWTIARSGGVQLAGASTECFPATNRRHNAAATANSKSSATGILKTSPLCSAATLCCACSPRKQA